MSIGNVIYYILWPLVFLTTCAKYTLEIFLEIFKFVVDAVEDAHEGIKEG